MPSLSNIGFSKGQHRIIVLPETGKQASNELPSCLNQKASPNEDPKHLSLSIDRLHAAFKT